MKRFAFLLAVVLLCGFNAIAQQNSHNSPLFVSPFGEADSQPASTSPATPSLTFTPSLHAISDFEPSPASPLAAPEPADPPQVVYGVKPTYDFQAYLGYTFFRFFQVPGTEVNLNGFNYSIVYYPDHFKGWLAADGEFVATFGSQYDEKARFLLGMGGARVRWALPRNIEFWAHALIGGTHYVPQTSIWNRRARWLMSWAEELTLIRGIHAFRIALAATRSVPATSTPISSALRFQSASSTSFS